MADQSTELNRIRKAVTDLAVSLSKVNGIALLYTSHGGAAFFNDFVDDVNGPPDLTSAQLSTAVTTLGQLKAWIDANMDDIAPLMTG